MTITDLNGARGNRLVVLIVDDDATFGEAVQELLQAWLPQFYFVFVHNYGEGADPFYDVCFHAEILGGVISDCAMPGIDGCSLCRLTRRRFPEVAFVLMSDDFRTNRPAVDRIPQHLKPTTLVDKYTLQTREAAVPILTATLRQRALAEGAGS